MKNFKLLLATTAILSTGALLANATGLSGLSDTTPLEVKAEIIKNIQFESVEPVDFGRIAWDFRDGVNNSLSFYPDSSGNTNPVYDGVAFHDGGKVGKVCFTEIVQDATLGSGLSVTVASINSIEDNEHHKIAEYNGTSEDSDYIADGGVTEGIRCIYVGGELEWLRNEYAQAFTGNITANTTVTVIYDSVNN